jgi:hypothetical protein
VRVARIDGLEAGLSFQGLTDKDRAIIKDFIEHSKSHLQSEAEWPVGADITHIHFKLGFGSMSVLQTLTNSHQLKSCRQWRRKFGTSPNCSLARNPLVR